MCVNLLTYPLNISEVYVKKVMNVGFGEQTSVQVTTAPFLVQLSPLMA